MNFVNDLLMPWLSLFTAPFKNFDMLWIIIPIYLSWILTELYQEKKGTSLGNAISNGVIVLWVGIDWARQTVNSYLGKPLEWSFFTKIGIAVLLLLYGLWVIQTGILTKKSTHIFGRIRVVTYVLLIFTPLFYGAVKLSWTLLLAILIFAPVFYLIVEIIDRITPNPKVYDEDSAFGAGTSGKKDFGTEFKTSAKLDTKLGKEAFSSKGTGTEFGTDLGGPISGSSTMTGSNTSIGGGFGTDFGAGNTSTGSSTRFGAGFGSDFGTSTTKKGKNKF